MMWTASVYMLAGYVGMVPEPQDQMTGTKSLS